jgi:hypothetical protein
MTILERLKAMQGIQCRVVTIAFNEENGDVQYVLEIPGMKLGDYPTARWIETSVNAQAKLLAVVKAAKKYMKDHHINNSDRLLDALDALDQEVPK